MGKKYVGNRPMIEKVMKCADDAANAYVQRQRDDFRYNIRHGSQQRSAAQAKRERKAAKARALLERDS